MVKSIINPDEVEYKETKDMDKVDIGYTTTLYSYEIFGKNIEIGIGKENYSKMRYQIVYYPIYLILDNAPRARIGIFEIESNKVIDIVDEDGDLDLTKGNILIFITENYLNNIMDKYGVDGSDNEGSEYQGSKEEETKNEDVDEDEDELSVLRVKIPSDKISKASETAQSKLSSAAKSIDAEVFTQNTKVTPPEQLIEETEEVADQIRQDYTEEVHDNWIQQFMKNKNYDIIDNEGGGDCFFAVIRDAYKQIGKETTVEKLRALLSREATEETFKNKRELYLNFLGELNNKELVMKNLKSTMQETKKRNKMAKTKQENDELLKEADKLVKLYKNASEEKRAIQQLMNEFSDIADVDSLEKFKEFIQTRDFWADTWAVSTMERLLNIKIIILSEESYSAKDYNSVMQCGQLNDSELERQGNFVPDFYIMTSYSGMHYTLITYKDKHILNYKEIPYDVKMLVINKCLERNAGPYYIIKDFRELKTKLGMNPDEGNKEDDENDELYRDLYEPDAIFMFYAQSNGKPDAGVGSGEKLAKQRALEFSVLNRLKEWRKKLDDSWIAPFTIDHHRFNSVQHYLLGAQFKKGFPDFYLQFSSDSNNEISRDLALAKIAGSKSGKSKDKVLRDRKIKIDADYDDGSVNPRKNEERRIALHAKFTQNKDLEQILRETKMAKLTHFIRSNKAESDILLMKVRKDIA
uniref:OTU domain-containing protein n=1 Tax=viral metagenome TaxID=1070528 RepID=A0A6C0D475_9ZZZZ